jgi:hypothetical protein
LFVDMDPDPHANAGDRPPQVKVAGTLLRQPDAAGEPPSERARTGGSALGQSSFLIKPLPCPLAITAFMGLERFTKNVSSDSFSRSPLM